MQELLVRLGRPEWYSLNDRIHHYKRARIAKAVRGKAAMLARAHLAPVTGPCTVTAHIAYPRSGRADPHNAAVVKHILDGLTDAGIWADDDSTHIPAVAYRRDPTTGTTGLWQVRLTITPTT